MTRFRDRVDAGRRLVLPLAHLGNESPIVLALPRGGVPVGYELATAMRAKLEVLVVRKLAAPGHPELGLGAIAEGGASYVDAALVARLGVTPHELARIEASELAELRRRVALYRGERPIPDLRGRVVIVVDDGLATGVTARAAIRAVREREPARIVYAAPVCAPSTAREIRREIDEIVCATEPSALHSVGLWYEDFTQTTDQEVLALLERARREDRSDGVVRRARSQEIPRAAMERAVTIRSGGVELPGHLSVPAGATGVVLFVHGSGSNGHGPRNRYVAGELHRAGFATLLLDLNPTPPEEPENASLDIPLLASRVIDATDWLSAALPGVPIGYFGGSTGAAVAIVAATERTGIVRAIVTRGGRPDLAGEALPSLRVPTLLIVGSADRDVLRLNREAIPHTGGYARLAIVQGATHFFDEPAALTYVARYAERWFMGHLGARPRASRKESA
jgi:putative phosphoribosyl transferase